VKGKVETWARSFVGIPRGRTSLIFEILIEVAMRSHLTEAECVLTLRDDLIPKKHVRISEDFTMSRYIQVSFLPSLIAKIET
jgi:hypothetical protein